MNNPNRIPLTERVGSRVYSHEADSLTTRDLRRRGTAILASVFVVGLTLAAAVTEAISADSEKNIDYAECVAGLLDDTPTLEEAQFIANGICSTGASEIDDEAAAEGFLLKLEEIHLLNN